MEVGGAQTGKCLEVTNEMRLVKVAARRRNIGPIRRGTWSRQIDGALKALHAAEHLGCYADLGRKHLDQMPLAESQLRGEVLGPRFARVSFQDFQSCANCWMFAHRAFQTAHESVF